MYKTEAEMSFAWSDMSEEKGHHFWGKPFAWHLTLLQNAILTLFTTDNIYIIWGSPLGFAFAPA